MQQRDELVCVTAECVATLEVGRQAGGQMVKKMRENSRDDGLRHSI